MTTIITLAPEPATAAPLADFGAIIGPASGVQPVAVDFYRGAVKMSYPARFTCDHPVDITLASVEPRAGEVRKALEEHPLHQYWLTLSLFYQNRIWPLLDDAVNHEYDELAAKVAELAAAPRGSLRLNPDLDISRYIASIDHHRMPGSSITDTARSDLRAGALYGRFASTYLRNLSGRWKNDGRGQTLARHVQGFYPDFKPQRILNLGCSVGHSTVAIAQAHARAESMGVAVHFSQHNAEATDFADGSFDLVCSSAVLHETSAKGMRAIFSESHRLLRPGGVMCHVDVPPRHEHLILWNQMRYDFESHYNNEPFMTLLTRTDWLKLASDAGFAADKVGVGYRKGTFYLNPNTSDFFTQGHPEGRTLLGSWYACAAVKD